MSTRQSPGPLVLAQRLPCALEIVYTRAMHIQMALQPAGRPSVPVPYPPPVGDGLGRVAHFAAW